MRLEIRKTSEHVCDACGSHDLIYTQDLPLVEDVTVLMERELVRRELNLAKVFRDHLKEVAEEHATDLAVVVTVAKESHDAAMAELATVLSSLPDFDVPKWRLLRRKRERVFASRISPVVDGMLERLRFPITAAPGEIEQAKVEIESVPDRS